MSLLDKNIDENLHTRNVNLVYGNFFSNYKSVLDKYFPLVKLSRKKAKEKPWITDGIKTSIKTQNEL